MHGFLRGRSFAIFFWQKGNGNILSNYVLFSRCIVFFCSQQPTIDKLYENSHSHVSLCGCQIRTAQLYHGRCHCTTWWKRLSRPTVVILHSLAPFNKPRTLAIHSSWNIIHSHATITLIWSPLVSICVTDANSDRKLIIHHSTVCHPGLRLHWFNKLGNFAYNHAKTVFEHVFMEYQSRHLHHLLHANHPHSLKKMPTFWWRWLWFQGCQRSLRPPTLTLHLNLNVTASSVRELPCAVRKWIIHNFGGRYVTVPICFSPRLCC